MRTYIEKLFKSEYKGTVAIAGGGTGFFPNLLEFGGGSAFLINGYVPYSLKAFDRLIYPEKVSKYVSKDAAIELAKAAFLIEETADRHNLIGVGATSKLAYYGEREGREHSIFVAVITNYGTNVYSMNFECDDRLEQEIMSEQLILNSILLRASIIDDINMNIYEKVEII